MYGMIAHVPFRALIKREVARMMHDLYGPECVMPPLSDGPGQKNPLAMQLLARLLNAFGRLKGNA